MKLPPITNKQQELLKLLYRYRFLTSRHIEILMHHKDRRRIGAWLKDLREKEYIEWIYSTDFDKKTQPAVYYLAINGIRYLRSLGGYPVGELQKRYKESARKASYVDRCFLVADCCIAVMKKSDENMQYTSILPAEYMAPDNPYNYLAELKPHLYLVKRQDENTTKYLLEIFEQTLPRYQLRKRLRDYIEFLDESDESHVALFVGSTMPDFLYIKRSVRRLVEEYDVQSAQLRVTTLDKLKLSGMTSGIWEDIS